MNWKALTKTARRTLSRNSSKILLGLGIAGAFTAVGFAITATPKAMILLDEKKKELGVEKLDAKTIVKTAAPVYIPTAISMAVSTGCMEQAANKRLRTQGHLFLNEVLASLGTHGGVSLKTPEGQIVGWIYDPNDPTKQNHVDFGMTNYVPGNDALNSFIDGYERSVLLHFNCDGVIIDKI